MVARGEERARAERLLRQIADHSVNPGQVNGPDRESRPIAIARAGEQHDTALAKRFLTKQGSPGAGPHQHGRCPGIDAPECLERDAGQVGGAIFLERRQRRVIIIDMRDKRKALGAGRIGLHLQ